MKAIVCGGRDFTDIKGLYQVLDEFVKRMNLNHIIEGGGGAADRHAGFWAEDREIKLTEIKAQWAIYGKSAGSRRNREMLERKPDAIIAFPGGRGTQDMIDKGYDANIPVYLITKLEGEYAYELRLNAVGFNKPLSKPEGGFNPEAFFYKERK